MGRRTTNMLVEVALFATMIFMSPAISEANLFVFGDSLYDSGMSLYSGVEGVGAAYFPYGLRHYLDQPAGRYSDGFIIPDFLARRVGLPLLQPFLAPGIKNYSQGINFASARACVPVENCFEAMNWKAQLGYFVEMVQDLKQQVGKIEAKRLLSKAGYLFNIGEDDYVNHIRNLPHLFQQDSYIKQRLGNLTILIKTIYKEGGRKFAFQNIGPLGCMPSIKYALGYNGTCAPEAQELAKLHNAAFAALAKRLETTLPGFKYSLFDFYTTLYKHILHGDAYGTYVTFPLFDLIYFIA
ncbi:Inactive GDSL esterase/lipase-like protein 25 [Bienertia sinuspersici]